MRSLLRQSWLAIVAALSLTTAIHWRERRINRQPSPLPSLYEAVGRPVPPALLSRLDLSVVNLRDQIGSSATVIWFFSSNDCLYCLAEASEWKEFRRAHASMNVLAIASGRDLKMIREFARSESLGFPVLYDRDRTVLAQLGVSNPTPIRALLRGGSVALIRSGTKPAGLSFLEQVSMLYDR